VTTVGVIGAGAIGGALAANLARNGQSVRLAARDVQHAEALAARLGERATAGSVEQVIEGSDALVLAVPFAQLEQLLRAYRDRFEGKVVIDPTNAVSQADDGRLVMLLEAGDTAAAHVRTWLPPSVHYAKAFGTLGADSLRDAANNSPAREVLFYAAADEAAAATTVHLIERAGFDAVSIGGLDSVARIETGGDLHQFGGLKGRTVHADEAAKLVQHD
jgi:predicted dinucleotide-binding enzyme